MKALHSNIYPTTNFDYLSLHKSSLRDKIVSNINTIDPFKLKILSKINKGFNTNQKTLRRQKLNKKYDLSSISSSYLYEPNSKKFIHEFRDLYDTIIVDNLPKNKLVPNEGSISYYLDRIKFLEYNNNLIQLQKFKKPYKRNNTYKKYSDNKYQTITDCSYISTEYPLTRSESAKLFTKHNNNYNNFSNNSTRFTTLNDLDVSSNNYFTDRGGYFKNNYKDLFMESARKDLGCKEFEYCFENLSNEKNYKFKHKGAHKYNNEIERIRNFSKERKFEKFNNFKILKGQKGNLEKQVFNLKTKINLKLI